MLREFHPRVSFQICNGLILFLVSIQGCSGPAERLEGIVLQRPPPNHQPRPVEIKAVLSQRASSGLPAHAQATLANALTTHATNSDWFEISDSGGKSRLVARLESLELASDEGSFNLIDSQCDRLDTEQEIALKFIRCRVTVSLTPEENLTRIEAIGKGEESLKLGQKATTKTMSGWRAQGATEQEMNRIFVNDVIHLAVKRALADFLVNWGKQS